MKTFQEFILEASCNKSSEGMNCPVHGNSKCPKIKSHKTVESIAKKHRLDVSFIEKQLKMGVPIEHEHTKDKSLATDIALQHLDEIPDYYTRLKKMEASAKKEHKKFKDVKEEWSEKYKKSIDCDNPKGFSQRAHCQGKKKKIKENITIEDANGNTFLEIIDLIKPKKMKGVSEETASGDETLRDWFRKSSGTDPKTGRKVPGWKQIGGPFAGAPCARQPGQTSTPKCGSSKMAANLSDKEEDRAFRRKNKQDPNQPQKSGAAKPTNVKTEETIIEKKDACYHKVKSRYKVWPSAYASGALVKCRKKGAKNWGTKTESTAALAYRWDTPIYGGEKRYCPKCQKMEHMHVCKYGPKFWSAYSLALEPHPQTKEILHHIFSPNIGESYRNKSAKELKIIKEVYTRIQSRGSTYNIILNWRGKYLSAQMFFPQFTRPSKDQVTYEIRKIYPGAIVLSYNPSIKDPTKPLLFTGDENESRRY